jgi:hypothetical protein
MTLGKLCEIAQNGVNEIDTLIESNTNSFASDVKTHTDSIESYFNTSIQNAKKRKLDAISRVESEFDLEIKAMEEQKIHFSASFTAFTSQLTQSNPILNFANAAKSLMKKLSDS